MATVYPIPAARASDIFTTGPTVAHLRGPPPP